METTNKRNIVNSLKDMMARVIKSYNTDMKSCEFCISISTELPSWTHKGYNLTFMLYWNMSQFYWEVENEDMCINKLCGIDVINNVIKMLNQNVINEINLEEC